MSDWEDDEPTVPAVNFNSTAGSKNPFAAHGHDNRRREMNNRNGWDEREQSGDRRNRNESNDRRRNDRFDGGETISFEIEHSNVGMVIGRGGCKIKEIQEKYNVHLNIGESRNWRQPFCNSHFFIPIGGISQFSDKNRNENGRANITIKGGSPNMNDARKYIECLLSDNSGGGGGGGDRSRFQSQAHGSDRNRDEGQSNSSSNSRTIEIDQSNVGLIIGRGGSKIKELEEKFRVNLKIGKWPAL